jgi:simple sugar transport system ATP-binding protein
LVAQGLSVIFISHKLDEVLAVSQRIAVLRGGRLVAVLPAAGADKALLAQTMVGREVAMPQRQARTAGPVVCTLHEASVDGPAGQRRLDRVSLDLRGGEIVAVAGVAGNGQQALASVLFGLQRLSRGRLALHGQAMPARPAAWVRAGVARIPEDRHAVGVVGDLPLWENAVLERVGTPAFSRAGVVRRGAARAHARQLIERFDVRGTDTHGVHTPTRALSGGNMQKLILGRALVGDPGAARPPALIVADQPTWGLDVGAVAYVHQQLLDACAAGAAVLLISEDLDEIFALADRIAVIHDGQLTAARPAGAWTLSDIGLAMAGSSAGAAHAP